MLNRIELPALVGGGYGRFWRSTARYRVLKGGKGSKKSATTALNIIFRMMRYPGSNTLVVRQVMDTHRTSTFAQLQWAAERLGVRHLWRATVSPMELVYLPTGQKILFRGFDDVLKLASTTVEKGSLCWVWIEEAYEIPSEADFDKLDLSVPRGAVEPPLFKQTTLTFNPWHEGHWLKARFFDRETPGVETYSTTYLCNEFLDDTDRAVFARMQRENPRKYQVAGLGEWGVSEGLVYENWLVRDFDIDKLKSCKGWRYRHIFGLDYGYTNDPCAFIAAAVNPIDKLLLVYDEHYQRRMLNSEIAQMIKDKGYSKERIYADSAEPKSNDDLRRLGIGRITPSAKGKDSVLNGIARLQEYKIYVHPTCRHTAAELAAYRWEVDKSGMTLNKPADAYNHLLDALRYAMQDVIYFVPKDPGKRPRRPRALVSGADFSGGWDI